MASEFQKGNRGYGSPWGAASVQGLVSQDTSGCSATASSDTGLAAAVPTVQVISSGDRESGQKNTGFNFSQ